jgi:hypothetical protein
MEFFSSRQLIYFSKFSSEIPEIVLNGHWLARCPLNKLIWLELTPVTVNMPSKPFAKRAEVSMSNHVGDIWMLPHGCSIELRRNNIADGIALEAAAKTSPKPMIPPFITTLLRLSRGMKQQVCWPCGHELVRFLREDNIVLSLDWYRSGLVGTPTRFRCIPVPSPVA